MTDNVHVLSHPLAQHKLTLLRNKEVSTRGFRALTHEIGALLAYEIMRDAATKPVSVDTPVGRTEGVELDGKKHAFIAILRAGLGVVDGMLSVVPSARVGHIGLYRDLKLRTSVEYYLKLPGEMDNRDAVVVSSVLASGGSAVAAVDRVLESGARSVRFACLVAAQPGVERFASVHPTVPIYTCAVDPEIDGNGFVVPGLGDAGDRLYGTE
ncbi:MAG: uracil phosphoribosyltransferase [Myxococcales bacterium]|nr:uracil phosphoribosyltransferase [Myxococcales bacterium]MDD9966397.1 uracil phosphoribosyltransferase [Myxococcales bacterium]